MGGHGAPQISATPETLIFLRFYKVFAHAWGIHGGTHTGPWDSRRGPKRIYESFMWGHEGSMGGHEGSTGGSCGAMEVSWGILGDHGGTMSEHRFIHHRMDPLAFIYLFIFLGGPHSVHLFIYFSSGGLRGAHLFIYLFPGEPHALHLFIYFL